MESWAWTELEAQVEDIGYGAVQFYLDDPDIAGINEPQPINIADIRFEDAEIKVILAWG